MDTVTTLSTEHAAILQVLEQAEQAASAAAQGIPVPAGIFQDVQEFLMVFVDRCHHGKEEGELFPRLQPDYAALVEQLEDEHTTGRQLALTYAQAVQSYQPGNATTGAALAAAARAYADFLRQHIDEENEHLLPVVEQALEAEDQHLVAAFERIEVERIGAGTHERLHGMIEGLPERVAPFLPPR
jgi:hemerythrin-like domain-containing protein